MNDTNVLIPANPLRVLSLGAGVQSTTLLLMMINDDIERADHVIFADTGWEPKAVYEHLSTLRTLMIDAKMPFHEVTIGNIRVDALTPNKRSASMPLFVRNAIGKKGMVRRQCTNEYKIQPLLRKQRELVGLNKGQRSKQHLATTVIGISYDESQRMRDPAFPWIRNEYPLVERRMTRQDCVDWCADHGFTRPPRSACIGCPFRSDEHWRELRATSETDWQDAVDFDHALRRPVNASIQLDSVAFLHSSLVPLDEVDLRTMVEKGQHSLFDQECQGMCGV